MDLKVTFNAFKLTEGSNADDIRIIVPKSKYQIVAEDAGCYYIAPSGSLTPHELSPNTEKNDE